MEAKSNPHCYICSSRVGVSNRNAVEIFNPQNKLPASDKLLADGINDLTKKSLDKKTVHSLIICKKCFKLIQEYDEIKFRMDEINEEITSQFRKTLHKNNIEYDSGSVDAEARFSDVLVKSEAGPSKSIPKIDWNKPTSSFINKISPMPSNLVIVGHKGKKITINKPIVQPSLKMQETIDTDEMDDIELQMKKIHRMKNDDVEADNQKEIENFDDDKEDYLIIQRDTDTTEDMTYLSEVDGVIIKAEEREQQNEDDFVLKELEIVDDCNSNIPMDEDAIFVEETEDGSIIRVVSGNNILQDEHGNIIYNPTDGDGIEMILPDQNNEELHLQYEEINLKDGSSFIKLSPSTLLSKDSLKNHLKKNNGMLDIEYDGNKNLVENLDMETEISGLEDEMENHTAAIKATDNLYSCLICEMATKEKKEQEGEDGEKDADLNEATTSDAFLGDATQMVDHMLVIHDTQIYICDMCGEVIMLKEMLAAHIEEHLKSSSGDHKCDVCMKCFESLWLLKRHQRLMHWRVKGHVCKICNKKFGSKSLLDEHYFVHTGLKPYICTLCNKTFASKYTYQSHRKTHTDRPRPFTCSQCGKSFLAMQNLTQHEKTHLGIKDFVCKICGKAFGTRHNLEVHGVVHTGYKPFKCKTCGKAFARRAEIRDHERTHTGERPYFCELCGSTFSQRSNLQSHKRATHFNDKRYKCCLCEKSFKRRRLLEYHNKASHTGERPFRCTVCGATFVYPEHYKKHQRIHSGEKPYKCEVCGKAFNSRDNRNAHRFVHSDKKPYECLDCGAGFMRKPLLYAHMHSQGHLSDTIVVNQPRLNGENETTTEETGKSTFVIRNDMDEMSNKSKKDDASGNIPILDGSDHSQDNSAIITKVEQMMPDDEYLGGTESVIDDDMLNSQQIEIIGNDGNHEIIETDDGALRIVQVRLTGGESAWVALDN